MHKSVNRINWSHVRHLTTSVSSGGAPTGQHAIQLYNTATPNGQKVSIALEELGLPYDAHTIHIGKNEQHQRWFLDISPNNRIPALVDRDGPGGKPIRLFESGAILMYLAEKVGSELLPRAYTERYAVIQWLMWQMGGLGPMLGQMNHFWNYNQQNYWRYVAAWNTELTEEQLVYPKTRFLNEGKRLFGVLDKQLAAAGNMYVTGDKYTIADIAIWPWTNAVFSNTTQPHVADVFREFTHVQQWTKRVGDRPAVQRGLLVNKLD